MATAPLPTITCTFRLHPESEPFTVEVLHVRDAFVAANEHFGYVPNFYAWMGGGYDFLASYGCWD